MKLHNVSLLAAFVIGIVLTSHWLGQQSYHWLAPAASLEAQEVGHLFSFLVSLASVVFLGVIGMMAYSLWVYRSSADDSSDGPAIRGHSAVEITWTVIPVLLVIWIASYSFVIYQRMSLLGSLPLVHEHHFLPGQAAYAQDSGPPEPAPIQPMEETIEVQARQWNWTFKYNDGTVSSTELHLPVNQRVHLLLTSEDVQHGFYVPNFRIKQDIVPNRTIDLSFTPNKLGTYTLHDSQFSGTYFALMKADVQVESLEAYQRWLMDTATGSRRASPDPASEEESRRHDRKLPLQSRWPSVQPADPPLVNQAT